MANDENTAMMQDFPDFHYDMGFAVDGVPIPDPAGFSGNETRLSNLDERDVTGYLHWDKTDIKHPLKIEYRNISWGMLLSICKLLKKDKFNFTYPSPFEGQLSTMDARADDIDFSAVWAPTYGIWIGNLKFSIIEY